MASIFTRIVTGEIPAHKVAETANCLAFLDITPLVKGHVLVVPKREVDQFFELDEDIYGELLLFSRRVARVLKTVIPCKRIGVAVIGLEVPHAHIHLVPLNKMNDINFLREKLKPSADELNQVAQQIREAWLAQGRND
jgi:histidine triad (HIT) family protein